MTSFQHDTFSPRPGSAIAYRRSAGKSPGVVFLGGFASDMQGSKAAFLEERCRARGQAFLRFDYGGHGLSSGVFQDTTIGARLQDAQDVLDALTEGPQIIVGSSMGGWIALLLALRRPDRVSGLVLLAPAPDFTEDVYHHVLNDARRKELEENGKIVLPQDGGLPVTVSKNLFDEARDHLLLHQDIPVTCPVRIIHGKEDKVVPWWKSGRLRWRLTASPEVQLKWVPGADHRLSAPEDLTRMDEAVIELSGGVTL